MSNPALTTKKIHAGSCLCGGVHYTINGELRDVINCHCSQCRKFHGHYGAYTAVKRSDLSITQSSLLAWYRGMNNDARRGFCVICGSSLFWDLENSEVICIAAGTLDQPTGLKTTTNIYIKDKADYYEADKKLVSHAHGLKNSI